MVYFQITQEWILFKQEDRDWVRDPAPASQSVMCSRSSAFRDDLIAAILDGRNLDVSFDNFPYYLR